MTTHTLIVIYIVCARLGELLISRRNVRRLLQQGAHEVGRGHYPVLVVLHVTWIAALIFWVPADAPANPIWLALFALVQLLRYWVIASLGARWTTRIIVLPGAELVRRGPYRWMRHPNYMVVGAEIALVPMIFGAWDVALAFTLANTAVLFHRIRVEEQVLDLA